MFKLKLNQVFGFPSFSKFLKVFKDDEYPGNSPPSSLETPPDNQMIKSEPFEEITQEESEPMRTEVPYIEDEKGWCTISYYEENKRFGELFHGKLFLIMV